MKKEKEVSPFTYDRPSSLREIENRLLEIDAEKSARTHNLYENYSLSDEDDIEVENIAFLEIEKSRLKLKRQFILDARSSWKAKGLWNVLVPIIISIVTAYFVSSFGS